MKNKDNNEMHLTEQVISVLGIEVFMRIFSVFLVLLSIPAYAGEPNYLCNSDEQLVFGCSLVNKKMVSICASPSFTPTSGYVQYRYGTLKKVELSYPSAFEPPMGKFFFSHAMFSGGGASSIRFINKGHEYVVFDKMVRTNFTPGEPNNPEFSSGVITRYRGKNTSFLCQEDASIGGEAHEQLEKEDYDYDVVAEPIDCKNPKYTPEFNYCAEVAYKEADKKLNTTYRKVLSELNDEDKQALVTIQRDWLKFRDAQCELETKETKKGTIWYQVNTECKTRMTISRSSDIELILEYR